MRLGSSLPAHARKFLFLIVLGGGSGGLAIAWSFSPAHAQDRPASAADAPNFAHQLLRDRRYDLAAEEYETYIRTHPSGPGVVEARYGLATARLFLSQYGEARRQFEAFLQVAPPDHPNRPTALFRVGETAYMLNDLPAARETLEQYVAENRDHRHLETAWPYLGDLRFRLGDLPGARDAYQRAIETFPQGRLIDRARYGLARALATQGEADRALEMFATLAESGAPDWAEKARFQLGVVQLEAGRDAEALAAFEALEQSAPNSPMIAEARLRRAEALSRLDRHAEAIALLEPIAVGDTRLGPAAAYALAQSLRAQERLDDALAACDDALARYGESPMAPLLLFRSAEIATALGQADQARTRYEQVAREHPRDDWADDARLRAAELALKAGDPASARALTAGFAQQYPESPLRANARLIEAQAALDAGEARAAVALLEPLLDPAGDVTDTSVPRTARLLLGVAYRAAGEPEKAAEVLGGIALAPDGGASPDAQYILGLNHYEAGRYDEAILALTAYLDARPDGDVAADALAMLAVAHSEQGDAEASDAAVEQLAARFPGSPALPSTRLRLGEAALDAEAYERAVGHLSGAAEALAEPAQVARANSGLGWALLGAERPAEAADAFARAASDVADTAAAENALAHAWALEQAGQPDAALDAYEDMISRFGSSPHAPSARLARARLLDRLAAESGEGDQAAELYFQAAKEYASYLEAPSASPHVTDTADAIRAAQGWALLGAGDRPGAEAAFRQILEEFTDSPHAADARLILAESAQQTGDAEAVEALLAPLVAEGSAADPGRVEKGLFQLGLTRFDRRDWAGARSVFGRILDEFPDSTLRPRARFWQAEAAFQAEDAAAAEAGFAALISEADGDPEIASWLPTARLRHAEALNDLKRWAEALAEAEALKADQPDFPAVHELDYARGRALQGLARFDEARQAYQAVIDANRDDDFAARARFMRGETYFHQENHSEALKEFLRVVYDYDAPRWEAFALFEAGQVAEKLGRRQDAAEFYRKVVTDYANDPMASRAAERLETLQPGAPPAVVAPPGS